MMSALGGGPPKADDSTDKLCECDNDKGGRVSKNPKMLPTSYVHAPLTESKLSCLSPANSKVPIQQAFENPF